MLTSCSLGINHVLKAIKEGYRDSHLNKLFITYTNTNELSNLVVLDDLGQAGRPLVVQRPARTPLFYCITWKSGSVLSTVVFIQKYTSKYVIIEQNYSFHHPQ
jgi:hypothetical protein